MSATSCSDAAVEAGEQLAGSAPLARSWLALEQSGPWGAKAFTASHLPADVGRRLESAAAASAVRPVLVRRPGRHADDPAAATRPRHVLLAHTVPGRSWLLEGSVDDPAALLDLDWRALGGGDLDAVRASLPGLRRSHRVHLLVCTNGRRDLCCAVRGRPVALGAAARRPGTVWEVTHTSGHRFAATAVLLPAGTLHGRLDVAGADRLVRAAERGETVLAGSRGRSTWEGPGQVAELAVRAETGERALDALDVASLRDTGEHRWEVVVRHRDGRSWSVAVGSRPVAGARPESCGRDAVALRRWTWTLVPAAADVG